MIATTEILVFPLPHSSMPTIGEIALVLFNSTKLIIFIAFTRVGFVLAIIFLVFELLSVRRFYLYLTVFLMLVIVYRRVFPLDAVIGRHIDLAVFSLAALTSGLTYWYIAGRYAGLWREQMKSE